MALVFQYGSNCSDSEINSEKRLRGDAKFAGIAQTVEDFELAFDVQSSGRGCAASDIVRKRGSKVWGVLYDVPDYLIGRETAEASGRKSFDAIEGEGTNYKRETINVRREDGDIVPVLTYTVIDPMPGLKTNIDYVRHIVFGLREHEVPDEYIAKVKAIAAANNPDIAAEVEKVGGELSALIAASHGTAAAKSHETFVPTQPQIDALAATGKDVLIHFPPMPGGCALMSAVYVARLQMMIPDAPVYAAAGSLSIGTTCVFGESVDLRDWKSAFDESSRSWDGHCWVMFGDHIADISIFRTAYSKQSPPVLAHHVQEHFGLGRGLLICKSAQSRKLGLHYSPQYVLTEGQITGLFMGARAFIVPLT